MGTGQDWANSELWKALGGLLLYLAGLRVLTMAWLLRSQVGLRSRTAAGPRRAELRAYFAQDASQRQTVLRQIDHGHPRHLVASVLEPVASVLAVAGTAVLAAHTRSTTAVSVSMLPPPVAAAVQAGNTSVLPASEVPAFRYYPVLHNPPYPGTWLVHAFDGSDNGGGLVLLLCLLLSLLWLGAWYRTRYLLLVVQMPSGSWEQSVLRRMLWPQLALRFLGALLLLPVAGIAVLLLWQVVSLLAAGRFRSRRAWAAPRPMATGTVWTTPPAAPPLYVPAPGQGRVPAQAPPAAAPPVQAPPVRPQQGPPVPQGPPGAGAGWPQPPVPTAMATAPATAPPPPAHPPRPQAPPQVPVVRCKPLSAHEPRSIGPYQLLGRIGSGGMGTVYVACLDGSATQVALKTLKPELLGDADLAQRFQREGEALARVSSAYTARVIDSGITDGVPYIAMDLLNGSPLDAHLSERGPIDSPEALRAFALALAVALDGVHRSGLVHRDLKPANIMLTTAGPRLLDFGIAVMLDRTRLTRTGMGVGTLPYMAPEQFNEEPAGPWTDVWAWGCCLVAATSGRSPFQARDTAAILNRVLVTGPDQAALDTLGRVSPPLLAVVGQALTRDPDRRPRDGDALLSALLDGGERPPDLGARITRGWRTLHL